MLLILVIAGVFACLVTPIAFAIHIPAMRQWREGRRASDSD